MDESQIAQGLQAGSPYRLKVSSQHERLIFELLPFKELGQFHEWLNGKFVRGAWAEFVNDFLLQNLHDPEPDKTKTSQGARDAISRGMSKYLMYHPDKSDWSAEDHHIRFVVSIVQDSRCEGLWSVRKDDWQTKGIKCCKAGYEVLSFLRATEVPVKKEA